MQTGGCRMAITPNGNQSEYVASSPGRQALLFALANFYVEADDSVLVACTDDRDVPANVVLALNDLLRGLGNVLAVSKGEQVGELLFDGHLGAAGGVGLGVQPLRIDLDAADSEQPLDAVADGGVERFTENEVGSGLAEGGVARLRQLRRLLTSLTHGEKRDDVGFGQGRIGAVFHAERLAGIAVDADGDVVVAHAGGGLQVEHGLDADRALEHDFTALQTVLRAVEVDLAFEDFNSSEQSGFGGGAAQAQIGVAGQPGDGGLHLQVGGSGDVDVELDAIERRSGGRNDDRLAAAGGVGGEVEAGRDGELGDVDVAAKRRAFTRSVEADVGIGGRTDARRIAESNILRFCREIEIDLARVGAGFPGEGEGSAAAASRERLDLQAVFVERQGTVHVTQPAGETGVGNRSVTDVHFSLQERVGCRAGDRHGEIDHAGGGEGRVEGLDKR